MRHFFLFTFTALLVCSSSMMAQKYEFGVGAGGSFYRSKTLTNGSQSADAGFSSGLALSAWAGQNSSGRIGGEFRYAYERNDLKLSGGGTNVNYGGDSHTVQYDILFHLYKREARFRPYVSGGGGIKYYRGTFTETPFQPLGNIALLTKTGEIKALASVSVGAKYQLTSRAQLRFELRDNITPFPSKVLTPNVGTKGAGGILNNFVPSVGIAFTSPL